MRIALSNANGAGGEHFDAQCDETLLAAAQRAHWLIRFGCRNGNCLACTATLLKGCVEQRGATIDAGTAPQSILLCLARAQGDVLIDVPGDPLHGSAAHARRCYAQLCAIERDGDRWRLTFLLPAGKPLPIYPGQIVQIEPASNNATNSAINNDASIAASVELPASGRELTVCAEHEPLLQAGDRTHLRYPLGYAYRIAQSDKPVWLLYEAATQARVQRLHALLPASALFDMGRAIIWPPINDVAIYAYARDAATVQAWYQRLLHDRVPFSAVRSDFSILRAWRVCRQDDNGNRFAMAEFLDEAAARAQAEQFAARGHKQFYWAEPMDAADRLGNDE